MLMIIPPCPKCQGPFETINTGWTSLSDIEQACGHCGYTNKWSAQRGVYWEGQRKDRWMHLDGRIRLSFEPTQRGDVIQVTASGTEGAQWRILSDSVDLDILELLDMLTRAMYRKNKDSIMTILKGMKHDENSDERRRA